MVFQKRIPCLGILELYNLKLLVGNKVLSYVMVVRSILCGTNPGLDVPISGEGCCKSYRDSRPTGWNLQFSLTNHPPGGTIKSHRCGVWKAAPSHIFACSSTLHCAKEAMSLVNSPNLYKDRLVRFLNLVGVEFRLDHMRLTNRDCYRVTPPSEDLRRIMSDSDLYDVVSLKLPSVAPLQQKM
jgi:hypothetical protein